MDIESAPSAIEGRMSDEASPDPEVGSQPSRMPKTRMRRMPDRNVGMLSPRQDDPGEDTLNGTPSDGHRHAGRNPDCECDERAPPASMRV